MEKFMSLAFGKGLDEFLKQENVKGWRLFLTQDSKDKDKIILDATKPGFLGKLRIWWEVYVRGSNKYRFDTILQKIEDNLPNENPETLKVLKGQLGKIIKNIEDKQSKDASKITTLFPKIADSADKQQVVPSELEKLTSEEGEQERKQAHVERERAKDVAMAKHLNLNITRKLDEHHCLRYLNYLSEKHENFYFNKIAGHVHLDTIESQVTGDLKKAGEKNLGYVMVVKGIHKDDVPHATGIFIDREKHTIEYFDSFCTWGDQAQIKATLDDLEKILSDNDHAPYHAEKKLHKPLQDDGYNCGVWALYFLTQRLNKPDFNFDTLGTEGVSFSINKYREELQTPLFDQEKKLIAAREEAFREKGWIS